MPYLSGRAQHADHCTQSRRHSACIYLNYDLCTYINRTTAKFQRRWSAFHQPHFCRRYQLFPKTHDSNAYTQKLGCLCLCDLHLSDPLRLGRRSRVPLCLKQGNQEASCIHVCERSISKEGSSSSLPLLLRRNFAGLFLCLGTSSQPRFVIGALAGLGPPFRCRGVIRNLPSARSPLSPLLWLVQRLLNCLDTQHSSSHRLIPPKFEHRKNHSATSAHPYLLAAEGGLGMLEGVRWDLFHPHVRLCAASRLRFSFGHALSSRLRASLLTLTGRRRRVLFQGTSRLASGASFLFCRLLGLPCCVVLGGIVLSAVVMKNYWLTSPARGSRGLTFASGRGFRST
mmetsp:Transcript_816/g.2644  ORF Transcript_816/g.2644 Transcript_816/m.2644 type:complete len:341 (+) Transcript_816:596-1618(+)